MKNSRFSLIILFAFSALLLSGCSGRGSIPSSWPGIIVDNEHVYVTHNQHTYVLQSNNGNQINKIPEDAINGETFFAASSFLNEDQLLMGSYKKTLFSMNPNSGSVNWEFTSAAHRWLGSALTLDGTAYAPNSDGFLYAIDSNGDLIWSFDAGDQIWSSPITDGDNIYFSSINDSLYAINKSNGKLVWKANLGTAVVASPVLGDDGTLYVGTFGKTLYAIDSDNGRTLWTFESDDWIWSDVTLDETRLYFGDIGGTLYAIELDSHLVSWQFKTDGTITGAPLITEDGIYVGTETGTLYAISMEGDLRWRESVSEDEDVTLEGPVIGVNDLILIGSLDGDVLVYAFNANGNDMWTFIP
jgi:outer membrane protein assembly factor BamB